jgi:hypothetical protein
MTKTVYIFDKLEFTDTKMKLLDKLKLFKRLLLNEKLVFINTTLTVNDYRNAPKNAMEQNGHIWQQPYAKTSET